MDSLSVPWTLAGLAYEYGVTPEEISAIARRRKWSPRLYEPDGKPWWNAREEDE